MREAARQIADLGPGAVLIKGGHLPATQDAVDLLYIDGADELFSSQRYATVHILLNTIATNITTS